MSAPRHLLIPFAGTQAPSCRSATAQMRLPRLRQLLSRLNEVTPERGELTDLSLPHERVQARVLGLSVQDGCIPWAAWSLRQDGTDPGAQACAWINPCVWHVAQDHIRMDPPAQLQLSESDSRAFLASMAPYFEEDGITLDYLQPGRWLARGALFDGLPCASLDRVTGQHVDPWLSRAPQARKLRRLQQEMQMLLYTHPLNEARERSGLQPVNSFWVSGAGALPATARPAAPASLQVDTRLREAALADQSVQWVAAWESLDAQVVSALLGDLERGESVCLTLCGERHARTWSSSNLRWWHRLASALRAPDLPATLESL